MYNKQLLIETFALKSRFILYMLPYTMYILYNIHIIHLNFNGSKY